MNFIYRVGLSSGGKRAWKQGKQSQIPSRRHASIAVNTIPHYFAFFFPQNYYLEEGTRRMRMRVCTTSALTAEVKNVS